MEGAKGHGKRSRVERGRWQMAGQGWQGEDGRDQAGDRSQETGCRGLETERKCQGK